MGFLLIYLNLFYFFCKSAVVENYEKTMVEMISEREQIIQKYEKELAQLKGERDSNFNHLTSLENTFSDLHVYV